MQKDLDRLWKRKRRMHRVLAVLGLTMIVALVIVGVRACSDQYNEPYNKEYRPMDVGRQAVVEPKS